MVPPWPPFFHIPLIEPDRQISPQSGSRTRLHAFGVQTPIGKLSEHLSEVDRFSPISRFLHHVIASVLKLRSLPLHRALPGFPRYYEPLRHPQGAPACPSRASGLVIADHALGASRVFVRFSLCTCPPPIPRCSKPGRILLTQPFSSLPRYGRRVGPTHRPFSRLAQRSTRVGGLHTRAVTNSVTTLIEGFSHFVTSMTAPICFRLERLPGGACHPTGKAPAFARRT